MGIYRGGDEGPGAAASGSVLQAGAAETRERENGMGGVGGRLGGCDSEG